MPDSFLNTLVQQLPMVAVLLWLLREILLRFDRLLGLLDGLRVAFAQLSTELQLYRQQCSTDQEAQRAFLDLAKTLISHGRSPSQGQGAKEGEVHGR